MFDLGWTELLLIGVVALIVVGPNDLPGLFKSVGKFVGRAKVMAREFSNAMEQAADEAGVKDVSDTLKTAANPAKAATDSLKESFNDLNSDLNKVTTSAAKPAETGRVAHDTKSDKPKDDA